MPYFTGIASGSPVVAASSGLAIKSRESEAAMPYFTDFGTFQCLILQISELSNALFYRHRERLASGRCKQRSDNPEPRERSGNALFCILRLFI